MDRREREQARPPGDPLTVAEDQHVALGRAGGIHRRLLDRRELGSGYCRSGRRRPGPDPAGRRRRRPTPCRRSRAVAGRADRSTSPRSPRLCVERARITAGWSSSKQDSPSAAVATSTSTARRACACARTRDPAGAVEHQRVADATLAPTSTSSRPSRVWVWSGATTSAATPNSASCRRRVLTRIGRSASSTVTLSTWAPLGRCRRRRSRSGPAARRSPPARAGRRSRRPPRAAGRPPTPQAPRRPPCRAASRAGSSSRPCSSATSSRGCRRPAVAATSPTERRRLGHELDLERVLQPRRRPRVLGGQARVGRDRHVVGCALRPAQQTYTEEGGRHARRSPRRARRTGATQPPSDPQYSTGTQISRPAGSTARPGSISSWSVAAS